MTNICPSCLHENTPSDRFCIVCGTPLTPPLGPYLPSGTLLKQGEYKIESVLGQGAFGITYKAVYCPNQARVAIKELWAENGYRQGTTLVWPYSISPVSQREQIKKFILEAANLQRCVSPHIAKVYDCFRENLTIYMVMELIDGVTLSKMIENHQNISETRGINYIIQIAKALDLVHQNNILHRDIKPENILINSGDRAVLIDFGTAREFIAGKTGDMTRILTAEYAPIEQYLSQSKRYEATDIYALCASLYELLTGQLPSASLDRAHSLSSGLPDPLIPPRQINPNISPDVEEVILRGMCHNVSDRVQTARELIDALGGETSSTPPPTAPINTSSNSISPACTGAVVSNNNASVAQIVVFMVDPLLAGNTFNNLFQHFKVVKMNAI